MFFLPGASLWGLEASVCFLHLRQAASSFARFLGIVATFISSPQPEVSPFLPSSPDSLYVLSSSSSASSYHFTQFQGLSPGLSEQHSPLSNLSSVNTRRTEIINGPMDGGIL